MFSTAQESNCTHLTDFELGRAPLRGRDVPPERPRPVLLPLRLLAALPVLVPSCTTDAHCIKPDVNRSRAAPGSGPAYPRRTRGPCRLPRGNATRQSPPGTNETHTESASRQRHRDANLAAGAEAAGAHLDDPDAGEGVDGARGALRLGLRRVPERAALVPPPREELRAARGSPEQNGSERELRAERLSSKWAEQASGREGGRRDARVRRCRWRGSCGCRRRRR